jgi:hypothetical protein
MGVTNVASYHTVNQSIIGRAGEHFNKRLYKFLSNKPNNPCTPKFYRLPKIQKQFSHLPPLQPIVAQSQSLLTPTAKLIDHILQPLAQQFPDYPQLHFPLSLCTKSTRTRRCHISNHRRSQLVSIHPSN